MNQNPYVLSCTLEGIPGFNNIKREALAAAASCSRVAPSAHTTVLADGTARRTVAAGTKGFDHLEDIDLGFKGAEVPEACGQGFRTEVRHLSCNRGARLPYPYALIQVTARVVHM